MKRWLVGGLLLVVISGAAIAWQRYQALQAQFVLTDEVKAELRQAAAEQNETAIQSPPENSDLHGPATEAVGVPSELLFGDLHVHTSLSFDSYIFGNRNSVDDAYRFARGEPLETVSGERMQLSRPLDFVALTDHSEGFAVFTACNSENMSDAVREFCNKFDQPSLPFFMELRSQGQSRPPQRPDGACDDQAACEAAQRSTWAYVRSKADEYYDPGTFTTFAAYEYSPPLPGRGKIHRNIFFRSSETPDHALTAFDTLSAPELWRKLEETCAEPCRYMTIPHNMNKSWGLAFGDLTIDGDPITPEDWARRQRSEPLVELYQIKGSSECGLGVGTTDEDCTFELNVPVCEGEDEPGWQDEVGCSGRNSFAREGLKRGLELQEELGFNPLQVGFIGSTDVHNGNPGDAEEWDWRGTSGGMQTPAFRRVNPRTLPTNPGGLAAVWAEENTREAVFDAMQRRETYATSGTRMRLRVFAGSGLSSLDLGAADLTEAAYGAGVPMGGVVSGAQAGGDPMNLLVWAGRDPMSTGIHSVQVIKGWIENGERREEVHPVYCLTEPEADGTCPVSYAGLDQTSCGYDASAGAGEVKTLWQDPAFDPSLDAFYYVRVMQLPTCRWSTYDAIRIGQEPPEGVPPVIQERAWSSPIWYTPGT